MAKKLKLVVVGIGGVGGYFGGLLAKKYSNSSEVEIIFVARGEHLRKIRSSGLKVIHGATVFKANPALATDSVREIGVADFILICTKSYDVENAMQEIEPCIGEHTVLLPLLNGVDSVERIQKVLPESTVLEGCVYIVSRLKEAGTVENTGNVQAIYYGPDNKAHDRLQLLDGILKEAGIEATLSNSISTIVWEKFMFISPTATATAYFDLCIGDLLQTQEEAIIKLVDEVRRVALAKGISVSSDITLKILNRLKSLPYEATTSMHSDFRASKPQTEVESLTGYVLEQGKKLKIATPTYQSMYAHLKRKGS